MKTLKILLLALYLFSLSVSSIAAKNYEEVQELIEELGRTNQNSSYGRFQETLQRILSQRRFREARREPEEMTQDNGSNRAFDGDFLGYAALFVGIAALIAVAFYFMKGIRDNLISDAQEQETAIIMAEPTTAKDALDQAQEFETHRDFRHAIRALYLATLLYLHEREILTYDKSATNREYLRQLAGQPALQNALKPVVYIFDDVWYGYQSCTAETLSEYRSLVQNLRV